ncbi:MAG: hypothetical protein SGPRY_012379, partial [Prymnesium sp.]
LHDHIASGDLVLAYEDYASITALHVKPGATFRSRFGNFPHAAMVGVRYGSRINSANNKGFIYLLPPNPELWTASLQHRTQILYIADISMICLQLDILPGSRVIEAGTGSGALSHALARSVGPTGHLFTYEFNERRAKAVFDEFASNGLSERVTSCHGDACLPGSTYQGIEPGEGKESILPECLGLARDQASHDQMPVCLSLFDRIYRRSYL